MNFALVQAEVSFGDKKLPCEIMPKWFKSQGSFLYLLACSAEESKAIKR